MTSICLINILVKLIIVLLNTGKKQDTCRFPLTYMSDIQDIDL